jgi:hypothetical protein
MAQNNTCSDAVIFLFIYGDIFLFILFLNSVIILSFDIFFFTLCLNFDTFLFSCKFIMLFCYYKSCKYDSLDLFFIYLLFLFFTSFPSLLVSAISILFHGRLNHVSTISSYVSIVVAFVTFNIMWSHICISCLIISFINPAIYNFMSKVSTIKTMTIK